MFIGFILGLFTGRAQRGDTITVSIPPAMQTLPPETTLTSVAAEETQPPIVFPIHINQATKEEFMALPGIGEVLANRILRYREENGNFASVMDMMNVEGIGEKRMEEILDLITTGG